MPQPSEFLVFNTRRPIFSDIRVRQALTLLFDFEWINRNYFFGLYARAGGLLRRLRTVRLWPPGRRARARAAEAVHRAHPAGYSRRQLPPARHRRIGPRSHDAAQRAQIAVGSRLRARRNRVAAARDQNPLHLRNPGDDARSGADRAGLSARPQARRHRGQRARGRSRAVRPAPARLRVRHAAEPLGSIAVARQRAVLLLGQPGRRHSRARAITWARRSPPSTP